MRILREQDFFCTCKMEVFFLLRHIFCLATIRRNIYFLLIVSWGKMFGLLLPAHYFSNGPSLT